MASARREGVLVVFDETLTGLYRCGERYFWESAGDAPDILVLGKGLASGFPASALTLREGTAWDRERVRPGSTYWNHPLACAAAAATLEVLGAMPDAAARVAAMSRVIRERLGRLELRGQGAMWCVGSPRAGEQKALADALLEAGVVVSYYDRYLRLLPTLDIPLDLLASACDAIARAHVARFG
jgi:acetylornithine/succinyldiaminopimelate/putrescine aminotransferase